MRVVEDDITRYNLSRRQARVELEAYLLSFIGASLSINESVTIAEVYFELKDWDAVKAKVKGENLIQARTKSSLRRVYQELSPRLQALSIAQLELLVEGNYQEKKKLLWFVNL